ncbi:hypothetical protein GCM10011391_16440 [Pullulanibacillus camelliae]|uniref:Uncharacterized protein n=1 Tax=Pullulanibacillus camelliae TaxID=1707096 RepID=A0A8J2VUD3_9BACL|nr:hypothetical protein [Pullulanibacillus camelliae]GGE38355.1 hypothetical protein GCM10011391_16440 [Pullulanibacillus camelliae]
MSREYCYTILTKSIGDTVKLETADGAIYQGIVIKTDYNYLYLCPIENEEGHEKTVTNLTLSHTSKVEVVPLAAIVGLEFISIYW